MQTTSKECKSCENFDLSTNKCLQHDTYGYDENKECLHTDCKDWTQCSGYVPDMQDMLHRISEGLDEVTEPEFIFSRQLFTVFLDTLKKYAEMYSKIADIVDNTDSHWGCDVKSAYMEIEKIVKGNFDHE